jgi:hypothetical protein
VNKPARSPALLALTASALAALGGRAQAQDSDGLRVDYRYSSYREADIPADRLAGGAGADGGRYEIDTHQFRLAVPMDSLDLQSDLTFEAMSGASPVYAVPDPSGRPVQVMSGASIEDKRTDLAVGLTHRQDRAAGGITLGHSSEDDYEALNLALQGEIGLDDTVTTLSFGAGYSDDTMTPTQGAWPTSVREADRSAATAFAGYARVLDAVTVVQTRLGYTLHDGYLADPYKQAYIAGTTSLVPDARPDQRGQLAWLTRLRRFFKGTGAALHADYRYYHDDWKVDAHTVDLAWHQRVGAMLKLIPGARYYSQSQAFFYEPYYGARRSDGYASSDYRLSPYGAVSASLTAAVEIGGWGCSLGYEHYDSSGDYALGDVKVENPGLVDFAIVSLGIKKVF